uniref:DUF4139 domain-containing protein n=1 Tax=Acrobeloides nanus TaxID=290746 RepID=A0A914D033_9BILA
VTIATLELDSTFYYACVPKKNRNVFLTAEIKNTSEFPLLSGNASIYLNSAFSSTTSIERIDIGETIKRSLGTDPGIKVEYKPVKSTYEKKLGVVSSNVYEQVILVKNNKNEAIVMTIYEQIPKSTNENINIKLILPEIREESEEKTAKEHDGKDKIGAKLNKLNNLEWKIQLAPDEEKELTVKWSIDYPQNESLEYYESEIKEAAIKPFKF